MLSYYLLAASSAFLYLYTFFPITKSRNIVDYGPPTHINNDAFNPEVYMSHVDKTILIVIDALRLDFVNPQYLPLTSLITKSSGCFNTIKVETPTVTLPRIKALISGNVPQFIDLVLNLASTEILQDSLIHSLSKKNKKVIFYGDDTWLKLFPNYFDRYEGTSSFFVKDFTEVDDNVTRNVNMELHRNDWDMMILHYLGLDHIGHVYGPFSSHIPEKLKEMDNIIYNIYSEMSKKNETFLLIITGDHGMRDSGGHGGSSYFEINVPLLVIGHQCVNGSFFQIDIPANLAVLLGVNIPSTSIGQIRSNLLQFSLDQYLFALRYNNLLLLEKANLCEDHFTLATKFHKLYKTGSDETHAWKAVYLYQNCSNAISEHLMSSTVEPNLNSLVISILIMSNILTVLLNKILEYVCELNLKIIEYLIYVIIICIQFALPENNFSVIFVIILVLFLLKNCLLFIKITKYGTCEVMLGLLISITILHPLTFFSSSYVEEEHEFWYYFINLLIIHSVLSQSKKSMSILACSGLLGFFRFLRTINSTGDKWANLPDFSDWLLKSDNYFHFQLFYIFGTVTTFFCCMPISKKNIKFNMFLFIIFLSIIVLKSTEYENVMLGKLIWFLITCHALFSYEVPSWILVSSLLLKPYNVILLSFCMLASKYFSKIYQDTTVITFCHIWLGNALYFAQGHSNSLASVDISVGYIGLSEYQPLFVILQVLCHTYCFPVLCHFLILQQKVDSNKVWTILFCNRLYVFIVTCIIAHIFRYHLFIWSVFAPKLFIEATHLLFLFTEICIYFGFKSIKLFFLN